MKKGMSTVVTTVIMVLLVIVAVGIVWVVVKNLISDTAEQVSADALLMDLAIKGFEANTTSDLITVAVERRAGGGKLVKIRFAFFDGVRTEVVDKITSLGELEEEVFSMNPTSDFNVFVTNDVITRVSIAPVIEMDSGEHQAGNILHSIDKDVIVP